MESVKVCMLIDDDHDDQLVFTLALKELDKEIKCVTVDNAYVGLQKLETEPDFLPDCIFLDLNLPGVSGYECLIRLKQNPRLAGIPVVIYTTSYREADAIKTRQLGAFAFITKPYRIVDLANQLSQFF